MGSFVWDNHENEVLGRVQNLLEKSSLLDCTLAAEGQYINAHKLILASSSPYFEILFTQERERNPIVILKDVKFEELKAIVDFIYWGKTEIPICQVNSFLKTAESLQVLGLIDPTKKKISSENEASGSTLSTLGSNPVLYEQKVLCSNVASICEGSPNEYGLVQSDIIPTGTSNFPRTSLPNHPVDSKISNNEVPVNGTVNHQSESANIAQCPSVSHERGNYEIEVPKTIRKCDIDFWDTLKNTAGRQFVNSAFKNNQNYSDSSSDCHSKINSNIIPDTSQVIPVVSQDKNNLENHQVSTKVYQEPQSVSNTDNQSSISSDRFNVDRSITNPTDSSNNQPKVISPFNVSLAVVSSGLLEDSNSRLQVESKNYSEESSSMPPDCCVTIKDEPNDIASDENECTMEDYRSSWNNNNSCNQLSTNELIVSASVPEVASSSTAHSYYQQRQDMIYERNNQTHRGTQGCSQNASLGRKTYTCPYCKKNFQWSSSLEIHVRTHTGEKPFWCSFCDAKFARKDYLKAHVVSHSGEKRYGCQECGKRFTQKHNLRYHQASHMGVKPFECYSCGKSFSQKRTLNNHLLSHIGE